MMNIVLQMLVVLTAVFADVSHLGTNLQDDGYHYQKPPIPFPSNDINIQVSPQGPSRPQYGSQTPTLTGTQNKPSQIEYLPPQNQQPDPNQTPGTYSTSNQQERQQPGYNSGFPSQVSPQSQQPGFSTNSPSPQQPNREDQPSYNPRFGIPSTSLSGERPFQGSGLNKPGTQYIPPKATGGQGTAFENGSERSPVPGQQPGNIPAIDTTRNRENENNVKPSTGYRPEESPRPRPFKPSQPQPGIDQSQGAEYLPPNKQPGMPQPLPGGFQPGGLQSGTDNIPSQPKYPSDPSQSNTQTGYPGLTPQQRQYRPSSDRPTSYQPELPTGSSSQPKYPSDPSKSNPQTGYPGITPQQPQYRPSSDRPTSYQPELQTGSSKESEPAHTFGADGYKYKVPKNQLQY